MPNDPNDNMSVFWPTSEKADRIADTKDFSRPWCPLCEPIETIDLKTDFVRVQYCGNNGHNGLPEGDADTIAYAPGEAPYLGGTSESEGTTNRRLQAMLRGDHETETPDLQTEGET